MENKELESLQTFLKDHWEEVTWCGEVFETEDGLRFENIKDITYAASRWSTPITMITKGPSGQCYSWEWDRGNTELQDNERYSERVLPVRPKEVTTIEWVIDNT